MRPLADHEELTAHVSPGYPLLLGLLASVLDAPTLEPVVRWVQAALGALTAGLYFLFARRAFHSLYVATLAGLFCALHPFWIIDVGRFGGRDARLVFVGVQPVSRGARHPDGRPAGGLLYGLTLAALALVRAACLPFAFLAVAWYLLRSRHVTRGWLCALLAFLGFVNGLVPWTVRNWQLFNEPVPIVNSAYYHLWIGNNLRATGGPVSDAALKEASEQMQRETPDRKLADMNQPDRFARFGRLESATIGRDQSLRAAQLRMWATLDFWLGERWFTNAELAIEAPATVVKRDEDNTEQTVSMPEMCACVPRHLARSAVRHVRAGGVGLALVVWLERGVDAAVVSTDVDSVAVHLEPRGSAARPTPAARWGVDVLCGVRRRVLRAGSRQVPF